MIAEIDWIDVEQGGRRLLPSGDGPAVYSPIVRFLDEPWPAEVAWSIAVIKVQALEDPRRWLADVDYRFEDAPRDNLRVGREFELYEGPHRVASGRLLADQATAAVAGARARTG